jgi:UDP-2,3-diacylglucosamine hydrolase
MLVDLKIGDRPIVFISDAHLGAPIGPPEREETLLALLRSVPDRAGALFLLGDLFDFWFEYKRAIPKGTSRFERAIADVVDAGIPVVYFGGNHDFWVAGYLREELGVIVYQEPVTTRLHGRMVHLAHGDGLGPGDSGYKVLKKVLRHPLAIALYRSIHPDIGIPLAHRVSALSRRHTEAREIILPKIVRDIARPRVQGETTAMVMGHVHEPVHYQGKGLDFLLIGDWITSFTHVRLEGGEFSLYRMEQGRHVRISPEPWPPPSAAPRL